MSHKIVFAAAVGVVAIAGPALAHHSFAMFDRSKTLTLAGTVKEFQWTNPHVWVEVNVANANGGVTQWSIEGASPSGLRRQGWKASSLKPGDKVTMVVNPLKDGTNGATMREVTLADGTKLGQGGFTP